VDDSIFLRQAGNLMRPLIGLGTFAYNAGLQAGKFYTRSEQFTLSDDAAGFVPGYRKTNTTGSLVRERRSGEQFAG